MKLKLTGDEIASIRGYLHLTVADFAQVLAVHPGTVQRWEGCKQHAVTVDGIAANIFAAIREEQQKRGKPNDTLGQQIVQGMLVGGALVGLGLLLAHLTTDRD